MKTLGRIVMLSLLLTFFNCKEPSVVEKTNKEDTEYKVFEKYLKAKNLSVCELKGIRKMISEEAKSLADKKYPNSLAQHDKYIERTVEREIDTVLKKYDLKTEDWVTFRRYEDKYCK